jgi:multicomponent K+:H+ antiporter subunit D
MTEHLPVLPVLLPLATALILLALGDGAAALRRARVLSLASVALGLALALRLASDAAGGTLAVYRLGEWPAPFGIVLVIDRLSGLMLVLMHLVALPVLAHAQSGWDTRGRHFHALFQFQLMGLAGAFATGDVFNLFVFFEVLLIASYVLLVHGGGRERLRFGLAYVVLNLVASALFLIGIALLYAVTGTLNLADLALRVPRVPAADAALLQAGAMLLLAVFGFKAALLPLHLWLPGTYAAAAPPVAALFAIMTKVGVYAIVRVHGVVFGDGAGASANLLAPWLLPLALLTSVAGVLGALGSATLARMVAWLNIASVGTILAGVGLFNEAGWSGALFYMVQSTLVIAALFLLADAVAAQRGATAGALEPAAPVAQPALLGTMMFIALMSVIGLPPLPGFLGKVMILQGAGGAWAPWVWSAVLGVGLFLLLALSRVIGVVFWGVRAGEPRSTVTVPPGAAAAMLSLLALLLAMAVAAGPLKRYTDAAARQLADIDAYAGAVLPGGAGADTARPMAPGGAP